MIKTRTFQWSVNITFPSTFWLKKYHIFHLQKILNKSFSAISKHDIPCYRKYHLIDFFFLRTEILSFPFLKISCKPRKCYGKIIFLPTSCVENGFLLPPEIHSIKFFFILKFISSFFLLNMNFPFVQRSCFYNNFFLLS